MSKSLSEMQPFSFLNNLNVQLSKSLLEFETSVIQLLSYSVIKIFLALRAHTPGKQIR